MRSRRWSDDDLAVARSMSFDQVIAKLDLRAKRDMTFVAASRQETTRWNVDVAGGGVVELLLTWPKWFDTRQRRGGGGAIDLAMHLTGLKFSAAVALLVRG